MFPEFSYIWNFLIIIFNWIKTHFRGKIRDYSQNVFRSLNDKFRSYRLEKNRKQKLQSNTKILNFFLLIQKNQPIYFI